MPGKYLILTEIAWLGLFALSLDLILGYAGIVSLGHAAFFGFGAYCAALLAKHEIVNEPVLALIVSGFAAMLRRFRDELSGAARLRSRRASWSRSASRFVLRELANRMGWLTGGADGLQGVEMKPILGLLRFDMFGHNGYVYCLIVLFVLFLLARRIVYSPFGLSLQAIKNNPLRASAIGINVNFRLVAIYTIAAGYAGVAGALLAQTSAFASLAYVRFRPLRRSSAGADHRRHRLSLWRIDRRASIFKFLQDWLSHADAAILAVLDRPPSGRHRAGRPRAHRDLDAAVPHARRTSSTGGESVIGRRPDHDRSSSKR